MLTPVLAKSGTFESGFTARGRLRLRLGLVDLKGESSQKSWHVRPGNRRLTVASACHSDFAIRISASFSVPPPTSRSLASVAPGLLAFMSLGYAWSFKNGHGVSKRLLIPTQPSIPAIILGDDAAAD